MDVILQYGLQGVIAYGVIGMAALIAKKRFNYEMSSEVKMYSLIAVAFAVGFIPVDLGNLIFNHIKEAIAVATGIHTINTLFNKAGGNQ